MKLKVGPVTSDGYIATSGEIRVGNANGTAAGVGAGGLRYNAPNLELSNGTAWISLGKMPWTEVMTTSYQMAVNNGYIANYPSGITELTLPAAPIVGDIVRVTGLSGYGWRISQNAGQSIYNSLTGTPYSSWVLKNITGSGLGTGRYVASSADGNIIYATVQFDEHLYRSADFGATWTQLTPGDYNDVWLRPSCSLDGTKVLMANAAEYLFTSADSGANWTARTGAGARNWYDTTSSSEGTKLAACVYGSGYIYTSADSGANWTERTGAGARNWYGITCSYDGTQIATINNGGYIYTSADSGANWTERTGAGARNWQAITMSADGTKLAACVGGAGKIYTSTDSGASWTQRDTVRDWFDIGGSSDGARLVASERVSSTSANIYVSTDSGVTWTLKTILTSLNSMESNLAVTATGIRIIIGGDYQTGVGGRVWLSDWSSTTEGTSGYIIATDPNQLASIELLYIGYGRFKIISYPGTGAIQFY